MSTTPPAIRNEASPGQPGLHRIWSSIGPDGTRLLVLLAVFVVLAIFFQWQSDGNFLSARNLTLLLRQGSIIAILATGVAMLIIRSEIDLSIGSAVFLAGTVVAVFQADFQQPIWVAVLAALVAGILMGVVQGVIVVKTAIPSFIVTLAGLLAFRGLGLLWTNAKTIRADDESFTFLSEGFISANWLILGYLALLAWALTRVFRKRPTVTAQRANRISLLPGLIMALIALGVLTWISYGYEGVSISIVWVVLIGILATFLMTRTPFGRNAYLIGSNREAAVYAGVNVGRNIFLGFAIMGLFYGIGGVLLTARLGASTPGAGEFYELDAIAAAVIGGAALRGGRGTIVGAIAGAILLTTINNGMSILNISSFVQLVVKAVILVGALAIDSIASRRQSA